MGWSKFGQDGMIGTMNKSRHWLNILPVIFAALISSPLSQAQEEKLQTAVFKLPPGVFSGNATDPFKKHRLFEEFSVQEQLERAGILFEKGTSAKYNRGRQLLTVVNTGDQLELVEAYIFSGCYCVERQIYALIEYIEIESSLYHDWMFENSLSDGGRKLRQQAQKWIKSGEGTVIETAMVAARSGQRAKVESIHEVIYPTEGDPPEIPNDVLLEGPEARAPLTAGNATAFETRKVGTTFELDPVLGADDWTIDINLAPEIVKEGGETHWPPDEKNGEPIFTITMPTFNTMKVTTQSTVIKGQYSFLGTSRPLKPAVESRKKPIILQFLRADLVELPNIQDSDQPYGRIK